MSFLAKLKKIMLPSPDTISRSESKNKMTLIVEELVYTFEESIERMSTPGSLMFHTAFVVYVPYNYFNEIHMAFGVITQEVTEIFHNTLREKLRKKPNMKFCPLCEAWSFDIIALREGTSDMPDPENPESKVTDSELAEKFVAVRSSAVPAEIFNFSQQADNDEVKTNRSQPNSRFNRIQKLCIRAIRGLKPSGSGYSYPINLNTNTTAQSASPLENDKVLATLKILDDNVSFIDRQDNKYKIIDITVNHFFVGGSSASTEYQGKYMQRVDSSEVMSPHFEIKKDLDGAFYIRPIGRVEQSQIPMPKNEWSRLSDRNASIKINGKIEILFNKQ